MARQLVSPDMTVGAAFEAVASRYPRRIALVTPTVRLTYAELHARARSLAANLQGLGIRRGDPIATLLWADADFVATFLASALLGAVIVPLPARLRPEQLERMLRQVRPAVLVASTTVEIPGGIEALKELRPRLPSLKRFLVTDAPAQGDADFRGLLEGAPLRPLEPVEIVETVMLSLGHG
jgi:acyl-CoA synthetase (AMP-forming)/AMP-acid ligase II